ncbi:MAG: hypothetical protein ACYCWW_01020 [Deltaproteobacteria bacterium]
MIRRLVVLCCLAVPAMAFTTGCGTSVVDECKASCKHLYTTCGVTGETEAQCDSACTSPDGGAGASTAGACTNPSGFYSCINSASCASLQGLSGLTTILQCTAQGGCPSSSGGNNGGSTGGSTGGTSSGTNGGATSGTNGGSTGGTTSSTGGTGVGTACNPNATTDSCAAAGYQCTPNASGSGGSCQVPGNTAPCTTAVGCQQPFTCTSIPFQSGPQFLCVQPCTGSSASCLSPLMNCQAISQTSKICFFDICGPGSNPANGTAFYASCNAQGTGDGVCLPFLQQGGAAIGVCQQTGTAAAGASCGFARDAGTAALCGAADDCVPSLSNAAATTGSCLPLCDATGQDAGPACSGSTQTCAAWQGGVNWGDCFTTCAAPGTASTCTSGTQCVAAGSDGGICG